MIIHEPFNSPAGFYFTSSDGLSVACFRWHSRDPVRAVVQIAHGLGEHTGRYHGLIRFLLDEGFSVYGNDHRGHGHTARSCKDVGDFGKGGFTLLVEDMIRLTSIAKQENPDKPIFLLGHSMGSFAAQQYVLDHSEEVDGLILSGSGVLDGLVHLANSESGKTGNILNLNFEPARTPFDWLSRDSAVVDAFISDPLCFGSLKPDAQASFFGAADRLSNPSSLRTIRHDLPMYLFSGSEDPIGQRLEAVYLLIERYRAAGIRSITYDFYPGGRHEMLNEINRGEVLAYLLNWLLAVLESKNPNAENSSLAK